MTSVRLVMGALLLLGCDRPPTPPPLLQVPGATANVPVAEANSPLVAGCADGWAVTLDRSSFGNNGAGRSFADRRLEAFRGALETTVRKAVGSACADKAIDPAKAAAVRRLTVQSASGAADPTFSGGADAAISLQWTFAENDLTIPSEMELRDGLVCWTDPESDLCAERAP